MELTFAFLIVDMNPISFYLRIKVEQNSQKQTIKLFQSAYIDKILGKFYIDKANMVTTPMKESALLLHFTDRKVTTAEKESYKGIIGSIIFLMIEIRPDITFITSVIV